MSMHTLAASVRDCKGKEAAGKLRRQGIIPAVFYGPRSAATMLNVERSAMDRLLKESGGENVLLVLEIKGENDAVERHNAMIRELQMDPVKDGVLHADFFEISMDKAINVDLPIELVGTPIGVTKGGILQHVRRELAISCLPDALVDSLDVDVSGLDVGDALHVRDLQLPEGITPIAEGHLTVAVVVAPTAEGAGAGEAAAGETEEVAAENL